MREMRHIKLKMIILFIEINSILTTTLKKITCNNSKTWSTLKEVFNPNNITNNAKHYFSDMDKPCLISSFYS